MRTTTKLTLVAVSCLAVLGAAGCASPKSDATPTATVTSAPPTTPSPSTPAAPATTTPATPTTGTGGNAPVAACTSDHLSGSLASAAGGGAAGSTYLDLVLTNNGTTACTLQGWPGVSFVGKGNGTQLGQAATFDRSSAHPTVTLSVGGNAKALLRIVQAGNYDNATCSPAAADGFRVYPPGQKAALLVNAANLTACTSSSVSLLTVGALQ
jgi:hypothetical protein